jgi:hypothetical protein
MPLGDIIKVVAMASGNLALGLFMSFNTHPALWILFIDA